MENEEARMIQNHLNDNLELKGLWEEHRNLEKKLSKIGRKSYLSPQEEMEEKRLKIEKLQGKTRMAQILEEYQG